MEESEKIIFCDFDGTITTKDSYMRSLFFYPSLVKILLSLPGLVFNLIRYFFGNISRNDMKEYSYAKFFSGMEISYIEKKTKEYANKIKYNDKVISLLDDFRKDGYKIIIVTASPEIYMNYFTKKQGYDGLICTKVEQKDGKLTGKLMGLNCNNEEKVKRIKNSEYYNDRAKIITLGNSKGDYAMFTLSDEYYYVTNRVPVKNAKLN